MPRVILWLEDYPNHDLVRHLKPIIEGMGCTVIMWSERGGLQGESRGAACVRHFLEATEDVLRRGSPDDVVGFILDSRVTVPNLEILGLGHVQTRAGSRTGEKIADYVIRNRVETAPGPFSDKFVRHPVLLLTVLYGLELDARWIEDDELTSYVVKGAPRETEAAVIEIVRPWFGEV